MNHRWENAEVEINKDGFDGVGKSFTEFSTTMKLVDGEMQRFIYAITPPVRGVTTYTLAKRVFYGGRKGRRAHRRLQAMGHPLVMQIGPDAEGKFSHAAVARLPYFARSGR